MTTSATSAPLGPVSGPVPGLVPDRRWLLTLTVLALLTRLLWVLVIHPPGNYVFSDMGMYVKRATDLAVNGPRDGVRDLAWQAYGTHFLLALPFKLFGAGAPFRAAAQ